MGFAALLCYRQYVLPTRVATRCNNMLANCACPCPCMAWCDAYAATDADDDQGSSAALREGSDGAGAKSTSPEQIMDEIP